MARRKFRHQQRHEPSSARSFQEYLTTPAPQTSRSELMSLVRGGEDTYLELKVKLSNPERIAQSIVALANTGGGLVVFGVNDNLRVEGLDDPEAVRDELVRICRDDILPRVFPFIDIVAFDNGTRIVAIEVPTKRRPYRTRDGRYFLRVGAEKREATREELSALLDESRPVGYENVAAVGAEVEDIDEAHLWSFVREFEGDGFDGARAAAGYPTAEVLERDLLLAAPAAEGVKAERVAPTVAGLLLFGRDERVAELLPRAAVTATRYAGDTPQSPRVEAVELTGNLHTLYESLMRFVERYCDLWEKRPRQFPGRGAEAGEAPVAARANYHRGAVAEAVANALVHRDLALPGAQTRLNLFDRSLEITNPRRANGSAPVLLRAARFGVPQRLNPQTAAIFASPAYGLELPAGGLPALLRDARLFSGRKAELHLFNDEFRVRLYGA